MVLKVLADSKQPDDEMSRNKDATIARIRKRWDMLPIQSSDRVQMWKFKVLDDKD